MLENILIYTGIGGLALFFIFSTFKHLINKSLLSKLNAKNSYKVIRLILIISLTLGTISLLGYFLIQIIQLNTNRKSFDYTIFLEDSLGNSLQENNDTLTIQYGGLKFPQPIDNMGSSTFKEIPNIYKDSLINLQLKVLGWVFSNDKKIISINLVGNNKKINVMHDEIFCCVHGIVQDNSGDLLQDAIVSISGESDTTDAMGYFNIRLPQEKQNEIYRIQVSKNGYYSKSDDSIPAYSSKDEIMVLNKK